MKKTVSKYFCFISALFLSIFLSMISFNSAPKEEFPKLSADVISQLEAKFSEPKIIDQKKFNNLTVAHLSVRGADYSDAFVIITPKDKIIDIDDYAILSGINIKKDTNFKTLAKNNPSIDSLWPGNHQYPESVILPGGIQQLQFTYSVLNGCHACAIGAIAKVAFSFDAQGNFLGAELLGLSPPPVVSASN